MACNGKDNPSRRATPSRIAALTKTQAGATKANTDIGSFAPVRAMSPLPMKAIIMSYAHGHVIQLPSGA